MVKRRLIALSVLAGALSLCASAVGAQTRDTEQIYGSQMMTQQERSEYQTRMRAAKTAEEREQIRQQHHEEMQARAKERGMTLPDEPPARGMGPGGRMGPSGGGMGPSGDGMGPGGGGMGPSGDGMGPGGRMSR